TGHINLIKREAWINMFAPLISYIYCCNTDVTFLQSCTAIKAILVYVTDYIMKPGLKTHAIFDCIHAMVNVLGVKTEIGSPMICSYLLRFPDHYTNKKFAMFYWKAFVLEAASGWKMVDGDIKKVKVALRNKKGNIIGVSPVEDYIHRPVELDGLCLYKWICTCEHVANHSDNNTTFSPDELIMLDTKMEHKDKDIGIHNSVCLNSPEVVKPDSPTPSESGSICDFVVDDDDDDSSDNELSSSKFKRLQFMEFHPLHRSHHIKVIPDAEQKVLNFVGGMLPRKDKGDKEYYCLTMLVLFRPWRSG
ncbi:hypothetical protein ARMGADRAFT_898544, partial [Armillaria gallica]